MKRSHRRACGLILLFTLAVGCGDDGDDTTSTTEGPGRTTVVTPTTGGATTTTVAGRTTTSTPIRGVTDGAVCSPAGASGLGSTGTPMVCVPIAGGNELRWRPA
ncbi:MAG TPA: hypothetical protein VGV86_12265 [Acidimicrobiales bacterium]|nr:hypothetical protein [Acidimicrobiales bacterium]